MFPYDRKGVTLFLVTLLTVETISRLAPISLSISNNIKTEFEYVNTRHRYPWICSLRTRGRNPEHICAVTLVSKTPWIFVGAAHCTYLCKDGGQKGARLDACCCNGHASGCSEDAVRCGEMPVAVEIDPDEIDILCGEWEMGDAGQDQSKEEFNFKVKNILRHPKHGVEAGNDVALFMIDE